MVDVAELVSVVVGATVVVTTVVTVSVGCTSSVDVTVTVGSVDGAVVVGGAVALCGTTAVVVASGLAGARCSSLNRSNWVTANAITATSKMATAMGSNSERRPRAAAGTGIASVVCGVASGVVRAEIALNRVSSLPVAPN